MKQLIVLAARQRCGTTALAETLHQTGEVFSAGEIFHHEWAGSTETTQNLRIKPVASFFRFKLKQVKERPGLVIPSVENQRFLFTEYYKHLCELTERPYVLIDVKYNSWHHFNEYYNPVGDGFMLLPFLKEVSAKIIHLTRPRYFDRYFSEVYAAQRNLWHLGRADEGSSGEQFAITVDPAKAYKDMLETERLQTKFASMFGTYEHLIDLKYGELFSQGRVSKVAEEKLSPIFGGVPEFGPVPLKKVTIGIRERLSNPDEVVAFFDQTKFHAEVRGSLGGPYVD